MKDLGIRVVSGAIGLMLLLSVLYMGGLFLSICLLIVSIIALREFYRALKNLERKPWDVIGYITSAFMIVDFHYELGILLLILSAMVLLLLSRTVLSKNFDIVDAAVTAVGVLYIPFLLYHIILLEGTNALWIVFLISFGTDTFAYLIGSKIGKRKLCPDISPKKSVEGSIGGITGAIIITVLFGSIVGLKPIWSLGILAAFGSIISQLGDLAASRIKRLTRIKDFGSIMPGHGGMLDRFDSVIFTAPFVYYYVLYFLK